MPWPTTLLRRWITRDEPLGPRGERLAAQHLRAAGYRILSRNLRSTVGEIDLVAEAPDHRTIVIVEVKAGRIGNIRPEVHVNAAKRKKLVALARQLITQMKRHDRPLRFDVVAVEFGSENEPPIIRHHPGAFYAAW